MNGLQALDQWTEFMDHPKGVWLGFINAVYWAGTGLTYLAMPWLSNKYGRKLGVYFGYGLLVLGVGLCGIDNDVGFIMSRFFVGCASATFASTVPLLINEIAYPTHRGIANALFMCGWYVGGTIAAFIVSEHIMRLLDIIRYSSNLETLLSTDFRHTEHGRQHSVADPNNSTTLDTRGSPPRSHLGTGVSSLAHLQWPRE
jgi:MFS family permease